MIARWSSAAGTLLGAGFLCWACSTPEPAKEPEACDRQVVSMAVITSPRINPTPEGEPRPVQVRLYQLKNDVGFLNASFEDVWKKDAEVLKEDLVKSEQFPVYPNTRTELQFERSKEAEYVVAAALFMSPRGRSWYTVFELPPTPSDDQQCGAMAPACDGGDCAQAPTTNPQFYVWIDGTTVEDGVEHADEFPEGRTGEAKLEPKPEPAPAPSGGATQGEAKP